MANCLHSPIVCFLDESATDDPTLEHGVVGGIVLNRSHLAEFDELWTKMLAEHGVVGGLHMKTLGPGGSNAHIVGGARRLMLADAVSVINEVKIFALAAHVDNVAYTGSFSANLRKSVVSAYAMTFLMAMTVNHGTAELQGYHGPVDFVLDLGNRYRFQIERFHVAFRDEPEAFRGFAQAGWSSPTMSACPRCRQPTSSHGPRGA